jgi:hypothetical protein
MVVAVFGVVTMGVATGCSGSDKTGDVAADTTVGDSVLDVDAVLPETVSDLVTDGVEVLPDVEDREIPADSDVQGDAKTYPEPGPYHKVDSAALMSATAPRRVDETTRMYRTLDDLPSLDVYSLAWGADTLWAGTVDGVYRLDPETDKFLPVISAKMLIQPVLKLFADTLENGWRLVLLQGGQVLRLDWDGSSEAFRAPEGVVFADLAVCADGAAYVATNQGLGRISSLLLPQDYTEVLRPGGGSFDAVAAVACGADGAVWLGGAFGVLRLHDGTLDAYSAEDGKLLDNDVRALAVGPTGEVFVGSAKGVTRIQGSDVRFVDAGKGKLPADDIRGMHLAGDELCLVHSVGATCLDRPLADDKPFARFDHYVSQRWIPSDQVRAVVTDPEGRRFVGTSQGIARIEWLQRSMAEKAAWFEELLNNRFWRLGGFVSSDGYLADAWDLDSAMTLHDKDNDGLWTQMQVGAWCYAYATTKDAVYRERARKALEQMFLLVDIPAVDFEAAGLGRGFVARSLVRDDEGSVFESKVPQANWHPVEWEGQTWRWKDDTSSDELAGHFFGFPLYYDLCAESDEERAEVASYAADIASYIIEHDFVLIDLDGNSTGFGHWEPAKLAVAWEGFDKCVEEAAKHPDPMPYVEVCAGSWSGNGWLNSIEILGLLLSTYHMTGDPKFYDAYEYLLIDEHYEVVAMPHAETYTITSPQIMNHSDHELAMLAYHTLIRYEPNPERRARWIEGLQFLYDWEREERNPLWAGFMALAAGVEATDMELALESLALMPNDLREWTVDNRHRKDAKSWPKDRFSLEQWDTVFAYDEIRTIWWNGNFYRKLSGGDGRGVNGPMAWLLPYWALRYAGVISD